MLSIQRPGALIAGVDVGKFALDLQVGDHAARYIPPHGVHDLVTECLRRGVSLVVMESTGGYENSLVKAFQNVGLPVARVQPSRVRSFARAEGQLSKSDTLDAALLVRFGQQMIPRPTPKQESARDLLRGLCDRRWQLAYDIGRERNRSDTAVPMVKRCIADHIIQMQVQVKSLDAVITSTVKEHFQVFSKALREVKGVGPVCVATLVAFLPELGFATREEITALAGLAPYVRESGIWKGKRKIFGGRGAVRKALYMSAMSSARFDPKLSLFYDKLVKKGKPPKVAYVAVARRILIRCNSISAALREK